MARRRYPSEPVDALDRRIDWSEAAARASQGATRWILGPGLLALHVLVFVVAGLAMLIWNIITAPSAITVETPLLRWGLVLALHGAAVLIGQALWRVVSPPAARPVYRPATPAKRAALPTSERPAWSAGPPQQPPTPANGYLNGHAPPAAPRTVVTSRRVTTMVVATARGGLASARGRYRARGGEPSQPAAAPTIGAAWVTAPPVVDHGRDGMNGHHEAPAESGDGAPPANGNGHGWGADEQVGSGWATLATRDEVISVTQLAPASGGDGSEDGHAADPTRSWLDGYLDGKDRERDARWTWVEAAASTWLARGGEPDPALSVPAEVPTSPREDGRPTGHERRDDRDDYPRRRATDDDALSGS